MGNTILLEGSPRQTELPAKTGEAIRAGMLLEVDTSGANDEFQKHAAAGGGSVRNLIAQEAVDLATISTAFADGRRLIAMEGPGKYLMILDESQTIVRDDPLESAGNGFLQKHVAGDEGVAILHDRIVAYADEDVTTGASEQKFIKVVVQ